METIVKAAILHEGVVYEGMRHFQIIRDIVEKTGVKKVTGRSNQGFITSTGRFVGREEAAKISISSGQIKELKFNSHQLFSEELW